KLLGLLYCVHLWHVILASEADVLAALRAQRIPLEAQALSGEPLVEYLKKKQNLFEVELTPTAHYYKEMLMDLKFIDQNPNPVLANEQDTGDDIPESFDGRIQWANCPSLFYIRDQSLMRAHISADDILSCCTECGNGCHGGGRIEPGNISQKRAPSREEIMAPRLDCCRPYEIPPCGWHWFEPYYDCHAAYKGTPACVRQCQPSYNKNYTADKYYGMCTTYIMLRGMILVSEFN
ncbi:hypothetical protein OSTOST_17539, partial [Ostertagia ostertagi]